MKKVLILLLLTTGITNTAIRKNIATPNVAGNQNTETEQPQIIYIPVPVLPAATAQSNEQQQRDLFLTFMSIAGNFGKILLNPNDTPHVIEGVNTIIDGIMYAAEIATKSSSRAGNYNDFIKTIALYVQKQAKLVQGQATDTNQAAQKEPSTAREQLLEFALEQAN